MFLQDELLAELEELEQQDLEESMKKIGGLPSVPSSKLPSARPGQRASKYNAPRTCVLGKIPYFTMRKTH